MTQLDRAPYEARRRVIDVSGDGDNNSGRDVATARDEAIAKGVSINGLVILTETLPAGIRTTPTLRAVLPTTIATTSSAATARSSWSRRTSIPSATPSLKS
jgi:hypothetical protein